VDQVRLPDLEVIRRYSIAVRREHAPVAEVLEALRADLETIQRAVGGQRAATRSAAPARSRTTRNAKRRR